jgi:hypothetical protein
MVTCGRRNKQFSTHALQTESALLVHKYRWQYTASAWETEVDSLCPRLSARIFCCPLLKCRLCPCPKYFPSIRIVPKARKTSNISHTRRTGMARAEPYGSGACS